MYRIEVSVKEGFTDPRSEALEKDILDLGIKTVQRVRVSNVYLLEGKVDEKEVLTICRELLADPIVEEYSYQETPPPEDARLVEVAYNPGVMDPVMDSVRKGIEDLGITTVEAVRTANKYLLWGEFPGDTLQSICDKLLVNSVVQHIVA
ncbi:MAG: phosphoribosylformylglycinamidine synthase subunit PurS, partial [Dehalococcoidales bacterium]|nr:phosphoribosylformylglycinamidine synthase subunit PurS [Dehalococcoidales bacterium]